MKEVIINIIVKVLTVIMQIFNDKNVNQTNNSTFVKFKIKPTDWAVYTTCDKPWMKHG